MKKIIVEGYKIPAFYLPVERLNHKHAYECWHISIALFILVWKILRNMFKSFWIDLLDFNNDLKLKKINKKG